MPPALLTAATSGGQPATGMPAEKIGQVSNGPAYGVTPRATDAREIERFGEADPHHRGLTFNGAGLTIYRDIGT